MKSLYLLFSPLLIITFLRLLGKYKKDRVNIYKYIILIILYTVPIIIDPINALIHGGDYWSFPYRYGFITSFILMDASLYYISHFVKEKKHSVTRKDIILFILVLYGLMASRYFNSLYRKDITDGGILLSITTEQFTKIIYIVSIVFIVYILTLLIKNKWFKYISLSIVSIYSIFLFTSWTIYYASGYFLCNNAREVELRMPISKDGRYRADYTDYTPDYGYILGVDTLDHWLHLFPDGSTDIYDLLGYHKDGTSVYSRGGTLFSDWLLNFKYIFTYNYHDDDELYTKISNYGTKKLYQYNYNYSYGIVTDTLLNNENIDYYNKFDYQNKIYHNLFNTDKDIISINDYYMSDNSYEFNYKINEAGYLYFYTDSYENMDYITINDKKVYNYDNYIKYLGYYNEDVNIKIYLDDHYDVEFSIGFIKKDDIIKLTSESVTYKDNAYYVEGTTDKYLVLPINNITGIKVYNNGEQVKVYSYLDSFISIKLSDGMNEITIKYEQPFFKLGVILCIIGLIIFIFNKRIIPNNLVLNITYYVYMVIIIGIYVYFYLYSLIKYLL